MQKKKKKGHGVEKEQTNKERLLSSRETQITSLDLTDLFFTFMSPILIHQLFSTVQHKPSSPLSSLHMKGNRSLRGKNLAVALRVLEVSVRDTFFCCCHLSPFYMSNRRVRCEHHSDSVTLKSRKPPTVTKNLVDFQRNCSQKLIRKENKPVQR